jgi:hypothetical protein
VAGLESIASLERLLWRLVVAASYPGWLGYLLRACKFVGVNGPDQLEPFERTFEYVADLWASVGSSEEFRGRFVPPWVGRLQCVVAAISAGWAERGAAHRVLAEASSLESYSRQQAKIQYKESELSWITHGRKRIRNTRGL